MSKNQFVETIKCDNWKIYNIDSHNKRLNNTVKKFYDTYKNIDLADYIKVPSNDLLKCRVIYTDKIKKVFFEKYTPRIIKNFKIVYDNNIEYDYKTFDRSNIDKLFNEKWDSDEIIIFRKWLATDTSVTNIAVFYDNKWITPEYPLFKWSTRFGLIHHCLYTKSLEESNHATLPLATASLTAGCCKNQLDIHPFAQITTNFSFSPKFNGFIICKLKKYYL